MLISVYEKAEEIVANPNECCSCCVFYENNTGKCGYPLSDEDIAKYQLYPCFEGVVSYLKHRGLQ